VDDRQPVNPADIHSHILAAPGVLSHGSVLNLAPFLGMTRELAALLVPVRPRADFRAELHRSLVASARQWQAQLALNIVPPMSEPVIGPVEVLSDRVAHLLGVPEVDRRWMMGAAAVGGAVSLGILAYVLRHREHPAAVA
jgi:hypothetical protein